MNPAARYQLIVEELQPKGIGAAELALAAAEGEAARPGLLRPSAKTTSAAVPRRVGLVASASGAADPRHDRTLRPALAHG